jgi:hypothetical protein
MGCKIFVSSTVTNLLVVHQIKNPTCDLHYLSISIPLLACEFHNVHYLERITFRDNLLNSKVSAATGFRFIILVRHLAAITHPSWFRTKTLNPRCSFTISIAPSEFTFWTPTSVTFHHCCSTLTCLYQLITLSIPQSVTSKIIKKVIIIIIIIF